MYEVICVNCKDERLETWSNFEVVSTASANVCDGCGKGLDVDAEAWVGYTEIEDTSEQTCRYCGLPLEGHTWVCTADDY